jgi:diguanylate cyclase (GGDEF)-like protein/PAS domain S-box-containing protein
MTMPMSGDARQPAGASRSAAERARDRGKVARKWTYLVRMTAYIPLPPAEVEGRLLDIVNLMFDAVASEPFTTKHVTDAGARLVDLFCTGKTSLQCSVDVLATALLADPEPRCADRLGQRVACALAAMACGYVEALRTSVVDQQDSIHRTLYESLRVSDRERRVVQARLDEVLASVDSGVAIVDVDGRFLRTNDALDRILGRTSDEVTQTSWFDLIDPQDRPALHHAYQDLLDGRSERIRLRHTLTGKDGDTKRVSVTASLIHVADERPRDYVVIVADDTELSLLQSQLSHQLLHDALTGLPNRQFFTTRLEQLLNTGCPTTVYRLHLDSLALISDGFGREVADRLLQAVSQRLAVVFAQDRAMVARFEGADLAILIERRQGTPDVPATVEKINEVVAEPIYRGTHGVSTTVSIGVAHRPAHRIEPAELLRAADMAVRHARSTGPGRWRPHDPEQDTRDRHTFRLAATMPTAWETGEVRAAYQPLVRLAGEQVLGVDALLRWEHPEHGLIPHDRCVELAERIGLCFPVGAWLLRHTCEQLPSDLLLAVTVTPNEAADPELPGTVLLALRETGVQPARLQLAMPASTLLTAHGPAVDNLRALADAGVQTTFHAKGFLPADPAFLELPVRAVRTTPRETRHPLLATIATELVAATHAAGATVIVDGVTTREQADWWREIGADAATGPLFTPDGPHDNVDALLANR